MKIARLSSFLLVLCVAVAPDAVLVGGEATPRFDRGPAAHRTRAALGADDLVCDPSCDDGDPCTLDVCERLCVDGRCSRFVTVCLDDHPVVDDGTVCDDGNNDTVDDVCTTGVCEGRLASCPCWDGDLRVREGVGVLAGISLISDPEPLCDMDPPPTTDWGVMCTEMLTLSEYTHPEICGDLDIYGSLIRLEYQASDSSGGRRCETSITDAGFYDMFNLRSLVEDLSEQELVDCHALLRQVFECPTGSSR